MMLDRGDQFDLILLLKVCLHFDNPDSARVLLIWHWDKTLISGKDLCSAVSEFGRYHGLTLLNFASLMKELGEPMVWLHLDSPLHLGAEMDRFVSILAECSEDLLPKILDRWPNRDLNETPFNGPWIHSDSGPVSENSPLSPLCFIPPIKIKRRLKLNRRFHS